MKNYNEIAYFLSGGRVKGQQLPLAGAAKKTNIHSFFAKNYENSGAFENTFLEKNFDTPKNQVTSSSYRSRSV